jgi:hypothetical protein
MCQLDPEQHSGSGSMCPEQGWPPWYLEQIIWYDERHRKCTLGNASTWEYMYKEDAAGQVNVESDGSVISGELKATMPRTNAKYLEEARFSAGVGMKRVSGVRGVDMGKECFEGFSEPLYEYTKTTLVGMKKFGKRMTAEVRRVDHLVGGCWHNIAQDPATLKLPGGRYQALYGTTRRHVIGWESRGGMPEWVFQLKLKLSKSGDHGAAVTCVTDMFDHMIHHGNKRMEDTPYGNTWILGHDALSQMWEKEAVLYLKARGFGPERLICRIGITLTGTRFEGKNQTAVAYAPGAAGSYGPMPEGYPSDTCEQVLPVAPPIGNRPEWMCLDSNLNADWERWTKHLCAFTSDLHFRDQRWCGLGTPEQVAETMKRAWAAIPATRIVQDILRYPDALQAVVDAQGGMPDIVKRRGRRSTLMLPTPAGMEDIATARDKKYDQMYSQYQSAGARDPQTVEAGEATGIDLSQEDAVGFIAYVDDEEGVLEPDDVAAADAQVASEEGPEEDVDDLLGDEKLGGLVELVAASYE